jgi:molybdopterin-guanine dinucleotide biosynthesis protein MobB
VSDHAGDNDGSFSLDFVFRNGYSSATVRVVSFLGASGAGKTTLIEQLIRNLAGKTASIAAIKHTHHPLESTSRGDTLRFQRAGAREVILAGDTRAILWRGTEQRSISFGEPRELLDVLDAEWVLIEGFKRHNLGPAVVIGDLEPPAHTVAVVKHEGDATPFALFAPTQVAELSAFLDRITAS